METELNFRFAVREDTPLILQMIRELADYEKLLDEVAGRGSRHRAGSGGVAL